MSLPHEILLLMVEGLKLHACLLKLLPQLVDLRSYLRDGLLGFVELSLECIHPLCCYLGFHRPGLLYDFELFCLSA